MKTVDTMEEQQFNLVLENKAIPLPIRNKLFNIFNESYENNSNYHQKGIREGKPKFRKIASMLNISKNTVSRYYNENRRLKDRIVAKKFYENNKLNIKKSLKKWRFNNKESIKKSNDNYYKNNREKVLEYKRNKYAQVKGD